MYKSVAIEGSGKLLNNITKPLLLIMAALKKHLQRRKIKTF